MKPWCLAVYVLRFSARVEDPFFLPRILESISSILEEIKCRSYKRGSWVLGLCGDSVLVKAYTPLGDTYSPSPGGMPREIVLVLESENPGKAYNTAVYVIEALTRDYKGVVGIVVREQG